MPYYTVIAKFTRTNPVTGQPELGERRATNRYAKDEDSARSAYAVQVYNNEQTMDFDSLEIEVKEEV